MGDTSAQEAISVLPDTEELTAFRSQWKEELGLTATTSSVQEEFQRKEDLETPGRVLEEDTVVGFRDAPEELAEPTGDQEDSQDSMDSRSEPPPSSPEPGLQASQESSPQCVQDTKVEATRLYRTGVVAEESGDINKAIKFYRQALQLDPNVDYRERQFRTKPSDYGLEEQGMDSDECESDLLEELQEEFRHLSMGVFCHPRKPTKDTHLSALPVEVLRCILRWVASSQCDMRAIEQVSMVCKGFYLLAREPQLWRSACRRLWGESCHFGGYGSWRKMFILKPHLHFNGVYISKTSYIRQGEHSVDGFYKPVSTVTYYRFLRFFPDGCVMYQTTPDDPAQVVGKLFYRHSSEAVLLGSYRVQDSTVLIDLLATRSDNRPHRGRGRYKPRQQEAVTQERHFHMELLLNKRKTKQLSWLEHYCCTIHIPTGQKQTTHFSINNMYTPFHFSRVKSYASSTWGML